MTFPTISTIPAANRYYTQINESRGIVSAEEKTETQKKITHAKVKKTVSECAIVAAAAGLMYFGFKRSFRIDRDVLSTLEYEFREKMKKPDIFIG